MKFIVVIISFMMISSCDSNSEYFEIIELSPIDDMIESRTISLETDLLKIRQIVNVGDKYLVVVDQKEKGIFQVFSLPEVEFLYSWGDSGRGPDEFSSISFNSINVNDNQIILYEPSLHNLKYYFVTDSSLVYNKTQSIFYNNQQSALNGLVRLNDSLYFSIYGFTEKTNKEFIALNPNNKNPLYTFGLYPETQLEGLDRAQEYHKVSASKLDGSKFAVFYMYHNIFKIFNEKGSNIKSIEIKDPYLSNEDIYKDDFIYRHSVSASDNYIFVFAPYKTEKEVFANPNDFKPIIEIWDWEGRLVSRFFLDYPVHEFTVSEKYGKIYSLSILESNKIYEYDLFGI